MNPCQRRLIRSFNIWLLDIGDFGQQAEAHIASEFCDMAKYRLKRMKTGVGNKTQDNFYRLRLQLAWMRKMHE